MENNKIIKRYFKTADTIQNRIIIPKWFIDEHGKDFYMEIYEDFIKLIPIEKFNKQEKEK